MGHQESSAACRKGQQKIKLKKLLKTSLFVTFAGTVGARDLPQVDAISQLAHTPKEQTVRFTGNLANYKGHVEKRLGLPTFLTMAPQAAKQSAVGIVSLPQNSARQHLKAVASAYKLTSPEVDTLPVKQVQRFPNGASLVQFGNSVNGIEVFRERATVLVGSQGELVAIGGYVSNTGNLAAQSPQNLFVLQPQDAIAAALSDFDFSVSTTTSALQAQPSKGGYSYFALNNLTSQSGAILAAPARAKPVFFRQPSGLVPAYYVEIQVADNPNVSADYYGYVISAKDGKLLFRHNQQQDAQAYTYRVWAETNSPNLPYPGPQGRNGTPHPTATPDGYQGPFIAPNAVTLQNGPISTNDPWLPDNATETSGNNVDAYADLAAPNGFSAGDFRADITTTNQFDRTYDTALAPGSSTDQIKAAVTQMFYNVNWFHNWYYDAGFDEAAGNAQVSNYGRGGVEGDVLLAEGQDYSGFDNANMATPGDGASPRMQMYIFNGNSASHVIFSGNLVAENATGVATQFGAQQFDINPPLPVELVNDGSANPTLACVQPAIDYTGKIVVVNRGTCTFAVKAKNVQLAGAAGMILANNQGGSGPPPGMGGADATVVIPVLSINQTDGNTLKTALAGGAVSARMERVKGVDRDGTIDNAIMAHEWGHYISNRLVYDSAGLDTNMAGGLGEGWADFHAMLMIVKAQDSQIASNPLFAGVYAAAQYVEGGPSFAVNPNQGFYYGIRRYPYSTDPAKNPLTFRHIEDGVALPTNPAPAFGQNGASNSEVHNTGEVWANMLWGCYASLINSNGRLTFAQAQDRMKRYLVAGYKMTPPSPTLLEARDALLAVMYANDQSDFTACGQAFAQRGAGSGAVAPDRYSNTNAGVVESYEFGATIEFSGASLTDAPGYCDADGIVDNAEKGTLSVTVRNAGFSVLNGANLSFSSPDAGVVFPQPIINVPAIQPFEYNTINVPIQLNGFVGNALTVNTIANNPSFAAPVSSQFLVNVDEAPQSAKTDNFETTLPVWTTELQGSNNPAYNWFRTELDFLFNVMHGPDNGEPVVNYLVSPPLQVSANGNFGFTFNHRYQFESDGVSDYDGGVIEISTDGGATWADITTIAGMTINPAYNGTLATGGDNPLEGQAAYVRNSATYPAFIPVAVNFGTALQGQTVQIRFGVASDIFVGSYGWDIDDVVVTGIDNTPFAALVTDQANCTSTAISAGNTQSAPVLTTFGTNFQTQVLDSGGAPLSGVVVTFTAPAEGASGTFAGGNKTATAITDALGVATAPTFTANGVVGNYTITATGGLQSVTFNVNNRKGSPPSLTAASDTGAVDNDSITNAATTVFGGTCTDGDVVQLFDGTTAIGNSTVCQSGIYSLSAVLTEGKHDMAATFTQAAITSGLTPVSSVIVDRTAGMPTFATATPTARLGVSVSGSGAETGAVVTVADGAVTVCTAIANANGNWSCSGNLAESGLRGVSASQTDIAGNMSSFTPAVEVTSDLIFDSGFDG